MSVAAKSPTSEDLVGLLRTKFPDNAYCVLEQVRDGAGFSAMRTGDVMVMGLWPSRGLELSGFEVKTSRSDWLREVRNPEKAESLYAYCDRWWLLAASAEIVQNLELPATWGMLVPSGRGLRAVRAAPKLNPRPLDRNLLASLLKRAWTTRPEEKVIAAARSEGIKESERRHQLDRQDYEQLKQRVRDFEVASGLNLSDWHGPAKIGGLVKLLLEDHRNPFHRAAALTRNMRELADQLDRAVGAETATGSATGHVMGAGAG